MVPAFWRIHLWTLWFIIHSNHLLNLSKNDAKYSWMVAGKLVIIPFADGSKHSIKHHETISILPTINFDASPNTFPLMLGDSPPSVPSPPQPFSFHSLTRPPVAGIFDKTQEPHGEISRHGIDFCVFLEQIVAECEMTIGCVTDSRWIPYKTLVKSVLVRIGSLFRALWVTQIFFHVCLNIIYITISISQPAIGTYREPIGNLC